MKKMTVEEILRAVKGKYIGDERALKKEISHITQDSRKAEENSLFFALKGERADGHDFIKGLFEKGVGCCLSEKEITPPKGGALILVESVPEAILALAKYYRGLFDIPVVGITGSVGKTTTKDMIASVLSQKYNTLWTEGNYNNNIGVPLTLFRLEEEHDAAVIEMGMNHRGEILALAEAVRPDIGVITNVGIAHIEYLGSREGILEAKCEMFRKMTEKGVAVLNADNDMLRSMENKLPQRIRWFGIEDKRDIYADNIESIGLSATSFRLHIGDEEMTVKIPVPGEHMALNALAAAAVGVEAGIETEKIKAGLESFILTKNRMNVISALNGITILNDVYNANPVSAKAALDILSKAEGRKIAVLGFMGELGEYAVPLHREVGEYAARVGADMLFAIGRHGEHMAEGAKKAGIKQAMHFVTQEEFWNKGLCLFKKGDTVLVKASRSMELEKTVEKIQEVSEQA